jgi:diaminopimelate decarboxylase
MTSRSQSPSPRPPGFVYRETKRGILRRTGPSILYCEDVSLQALAEQYGTPLYVYSVEMIRERYNAFDAAFAASFEGQPHTICYSVKANSNLTLLRLLAKKGCGFDVVSGGELERVLVADRKAAKKIVFSGVGKTGEELTAALKAGILLFNVESESELWALAECAGRLRKTAPLALRVNPDVAAVTHPYISTGLRKHKFGVPIGEARALYAKASGARYLNVRGVSVHIGSQITDVAPFGEAMERVADLVRELRRDDHRIDYIDAGGGLGIAYEKANGNVFPASVAAYARALAAPLRGLEVRLLLEPGRSIVGPAGVLVTSVIYRKENDGRRFLVVDAAMNDLIRPALYGAYHEIVPVTRRADSATKAEVTKCEVTDVVGPVCETGDFFARDRELPLVAEGDRLAILDAGAYGMVLSSNYNSRPRPAEVLVSGKSAKIIRRRERVSDLLRAEL